MPYLVQASMAGKPSWFTHNRAGEKATSVRGCVCCECVAEWTYVLYFGGAMWCSQVLLHLLRAHSMESMPVEYTYGKEYSMHTSNDLKTSSNSNEF